MPYSLGKSLAGRKCLIKIGSGTVYMGEVLFVDDGGLALIDANIITNIAGKPPSSEDMCRLAKEGDLSSFQFTGEPIDKITLMGNMEIVKMTDLVIKNLPFNPALLVNIVDAGFSDRTGPFLVQQGITYLGDLVIRTEEDLYRGPNIGRVTMEEIKRIVGWYGLQLGMSIPEWPPANLDDLVRRMRNA